MSTDFGFTDLECKIIKAQIERRAKYREMFLKAKSDPCKHSKESGYVFDEAIQRYLSLKANQLDYFTFNPKTISFGFFSLIVPAFVYGYAIWYRRQKFLKAVACGKIKPKDRLFKYC